MPATDTPAITDLVSRLRQGDNRALARAISLVENDAPEAPGLLSACFPHTGRALRIGITGAPGAGKSSLVDRLAQQFRHADRTVGVVAVDPTSPFTGGALLGDRIRLREHASDPGFYVRSMATRGSLGGLALATADVALVLEASGKDILLIETVGVGQDEIEIARLADFILVILVPGMGDDVQSLKAGVMEIADIFVINKADREGADRVEQEIRGLQSLAQTHEPRNPPVVRTIATTGDGVPALMQSIGDLEQWLREENRLAARRTLHWQRRLDAMLRTELMRRARKNGFDSKLLEFHAARIASGQQDPWQLVGQLTEKVFSSGS
ncbi:MAG TPA: methylmalonyl Co-A mutase-associated GTPase MeaB [Acidobacteriaceae bacterium]|nr:methylmalonyl Co-A mutase-associated GTPase MeaB [Acidobacteriaceae bacterium]